MRKAALALGLALGLTAESAQAVAVSWTLTGTIYESYDDFGNVLGQGIGSAVANGDELRITFLFDLAKQPNDECADSFYACWVNSDGTDTTSGYGAPGGSWIESTATVYSGTTTFVVPDVIVGSGSYANYDVTFKRTDNSFDQLEVRDNASSSLYWNDGANYINRTVSDITTAWAQAAGDMFGDGSSQTPSLMDPVSLAGPYSGALSVYRKQTGVSCLWGQFCTYLPNYYGYANATITSLTSSVVPLPSTLALLGLGVVGLAATRRRKHKHVVAVDD